MTLIKILADRSVQAYNDIQNLNETGLDKELNLAGRQGRILSLDEDDLDKVKQVVFACLLDKRLRLEQEIKQLTTKSDDGGEEVMPGMRD
jgi:hypothetical protein